MMRAGFPQARRLCRDCAAEFGVRLADPSAPLGSESLAAAALRHGGFAVIAVVADHVVLSDVDFSCVWESNVRSLTEKSGASPSQASRRCTFDSNRPLTGIRGLDLASVWLSWRSVVVIDAWPSRSRTWASGTPCSTSREAYSCRRSCHRRLMRRKVAWDSSERLEIDVGKPQREHLALPHPGVERRDDHRLGMRRRRIEQRGLFARVDSPASLVVLAQLLDQRLGTAPERRAVDVLTSIPMPSGVGDTSQYGSGIRPPRPVEAHLAVHGTRPALPR
jgi:hypothetical protein